MANFTLEREFKILNQRRVAQVETNNAELGIEKIERQIFSMEMKTAVR
jgi:hypothetical protein